MEDLRKVDLAQAIGVIERPLDKKQIKQRDGGFGKKLDYIEGSTVTRLLNEAFGYAWDFYVVEKKIIQSEPKKKKDGQVEAQPPYVEVLGRLVIPGLCTKEQYGTKILLGGASEQEGAAKSAATDALKKCATLVGIGLELYETEDDAPASNRGGGGTNNYNSQNSYRSYQQQNQSAGTGAQGGNPWAGKDNDIKRLKELKAIIGVGSNEQLNPFVREFTGNAGSTYNDVTPTNITAFNKFLEKKAETA
jgi:hypothetical protein